MEMNWTWITSDEMHTLTECKCQWFCSVSHVHDILFGMLPQAYSVSTSLWACCEGEWHKTVWESPSPHHTHTHMHPCTSMTAGWGYCPLFFGAEVLSASFLCLSQRFSQLCGALTEIYLKRWEGFSWGHYKHPPFPLSLILTSADLVHH